MPEIYCCVPGCLTKINDGVPLHSFPSPTLERLMFKVWVFNIADELAALDSETIYFEKRVCDKHFDETQYEKGRLKKNAAPVLNMPDPLLLNSRGKPVCTASTSMPAKSNKRKSKEEGLSNSNIQPSGNILNQMAVFDFSKAIGETIIIDDGVTEMNEDSVTNKTKEKKTIHNKIIFEEDAMIERQPNQETKVSEDSVTYDTKKRKPIDETILLRGSVTSDTNKRKSISVDSIISDMRKNNLINLNLKAQDTGTVINNKKRKINNTKNKKPISEKIVFEEDEIKQEDEVIEKAEEKEEDGKEEIKLSFKEINTLAKNLISIIKAFYQYILRDNTSFPFSESDHTLKPALMPDTFRLRQKEFQKIKHKYFELSYTTMNTKILPQIKNVGFINHFLETIVSMAKSKYMTWKCEKRIVQTYFFELIQWTKQKSGYIISTLKSPSTENMSLNEQLIKPLQLLNNSQPKSASNITTPSPPPKTQNNSVSSTENADKDINININTDTLINLVIDCHHRKTTDTVECTETQDDKASRVEPAAKQTQTSEKNVNDNKQIISSCDPVPCEEAPYEDSEHDTTDPESSNSSLMLFYEPDTEVKVSTQELTTRNREDNERCESSNEDYTTPDLIIVKPLERPSLVIDDPLEGPGQIIGDPLERPGQIIGDPLNRSSQIIGDPLKRPGQIIGDPLEGPGQICGDPLQRPAQIIGDPLERLGQINGDPLERPGQIIDDPSKRPAQVISDPGQPLETPGQITGDPIEKPLPAKRRRLSNPSGDWTDDSIEVSTPDPSNRDTTQDAQTETINLVSPVTSTPPSPIPSLEASEPCHEDVESTPSIVNNSSSSQSLRDDEMDIIVNYGSEYESDGEDDEDDIGFPVFVPRAQRIYFEDSDDDPPTLVPEPSSAETLEPSSAKTLEPSSAKTLEPSSAETLEPSSAETLEPSSAETLEPSSAETLEPSSAETLEPSSAETLEPSSAETPDPYSAKTLEPSSAKTLEPSSAKTLEPSSAKTLEPFSAKIVKSEPSPSPPPHQPIDLFNFEWRAFPNPPVPVTERREDFSDANCGPAAPFLTPYDAFTTIWNRKLMKYIAAETNKYAQQFAERQILEGSLKPTSRIISWCETSADELYVYFGLLLATGLCVKADLKEYWSKDMATPCFRKYMSINRFSLLSRCLHFAYNTDQIQSLTRPQAQLFKITPIIKHLNNIFGTFYRLNRNIVIDDSLTQWRGWLDGKHLFKKGSEGVKAFEVCDAQSGYLWRIKLHAGGPVSESVTAILVLELLKGLENRGHTVFMDNYYSSPAITRVLKSLSFDSVSTFRTLRQYVPAQLTTDLAVGQISGCTSGDVDVIVYRDRVAMLSTYHGRTIHTANGKTKPLAIHDYNACMSGIDKKDQILNSHPIERKRPQVWYKKLFRRLLNVSVYNAFILHRDSTLPETPTRVTKHREFRKTLINEILSKHKVRNPLLLAQVVEPVERPVFTQDVLQHFPAEYGLIFSDSKKKERIRRSCTICRKRVQYYCPSCNVALCPSVCHRAYHGGQSS